MKANKIEMPHFEDYSVRPLNNCVPTLVKHKSTGEVSTVILAQTGGDVIWFEKDGCICYSSEEYVYEAYAIIREYVEGEKLTITM